MFLHDILSTAVVKLEDILNAVFSPDEVVRGHSGRFVAHKSLNDYLIRIVYEYENYENEFPVVITLYIAKKERYFRDGIYEDKILTDSDILEIRILDEKPKYGEEYDENMIIHYSEENRVVKIEILDASKTILSFLQPILEQKPIKGVTRV